MQKIIDESKNANQGISAIQSDAVGHAVIENTDESPVLPDATDVSSLNPDKPVATSSPKAKNIEISEPTRMYQRQQQDWKVKNRTFY